MNSGPREAALDMPIPDAKAQAEDERPPLNWKAMSKNPAFIATATLTVTFIFAFSGLIKILLNIWFEPDTLYSHGPLIPLMSGYIIWSRWDKISKNPVRGTLIPLLILIPLLYLTFVASRGSVKMLLSTLFIASAMTTVWIVAGWKWMWTTAPAVLYMVFALPLWTSVVDRFTQPMQQLSTNMAMKMLQVTGFDPMQSDPTTIHLNNYVLNVAAPCSGAKLTLALIAFTIFFILVGRGKIWANIALIAIVLPFTLFINGLRIAMIGVVGNAFGMEAGQHFHDYGGYISLIICFILLRYITRALGFKS